MPFPVSFYFRCNDRGYFFFNDTATTEIYTLSLHDALPICPRQGAQGERAGPDRRSDHRAVRGRALTRRTHRRRDRKSTRLNSSHANISYAVFCLKKKTISHLERKSKQQKSSHVIIS